MENLALASRSLPELERRDAGGAMEGADEVGEVAEADVIGDVGDRDVVVGEQPRRMPQPRAHQILMRGDAEHVCEQPQEMERADFSGRGGLFQIDREVRMRIDPQRGFHRAAAVPGRCRCTRAGPSRNHLDEAAGEQRTDLIEALPDQVGEDLLESLEKVDPEAAAEVEALAKWPEDSAGGLMTTDYISVPLELTVADVIELMQSRAKELGVSLGWYLGPDLPEILFDADGIHRAVLNIITNAIDASPAEAAVVLRTRLETSPRPAP